MDTIIRSGVDMNNDLDEIISQIPGWVETSNLEMNSEFKLY